MANFAWTCPYCGHVQTVTEDKHDIGVAQVPVDSKKYPALAVQAIAIGCANSKCDEVQIVAQVGRYVHRLIEVVHTPFATLYQRTSSDPKVTQNLSQITFQSQL
jgi:hypothetical protein